MSTNISISTWKPWIHALRPQSLTASLAPVMIGTALAFSYDGRVDWSILLSVLLSAFFIQTGTNLINDAFDFRFGADGEGRIGPIRLVQSKILTANQVQFLGFSSFLLSILCAIPLILKGGILFLAILFISCLCGYFYTGGKRSLAYTGLADFFVVLFFGLVLTGSAFYLQTGILSGQAMVAGLQIGLLATVIIAVNNTRDHVQDRLAGRRSLPVRFGVLFGKGEILFCSVVPLLLGGYWILIGKFFCALIPLLITPLTYKLNRGIWSHEPGKIYNSFFGFAALSHLLFGILLSLSFLVDAELNRG